MRAIAAGSHTGYEGREMVGVEAKDVSVVYPVYDARSRSLKNRLIRSIGGAIAVKEGTVVSVNALQNLTLTLRPGDRVALIGANGAGKSTLLRVLAGILEPTTGDLKICGRVSSLIDMSMGMDPEATGYENIIMRSVFLGATFAEAKARVAEIEAFSELGNFLYLPMHTYSTGMTLRLSFAIATALQPEILVLDELIGTGDAAFSSKARARIDELVGALQILILATHDLEAARRLCTRGLVLKHGRAVIDAPIEQAIEAYKGNDTRQEPPHEDSDSPTKRIAIG
jgi:ABC-2 type transport system ATP-binding protein/lipopolysaccharide transport system ATP-binding protein